jgi:(p)ppGpp synthase/HD superfamily hydrolase
MSTLERAIAIAAGAHEGQRDKGGAPYILHPLRVMLAMSSDEDRTAAVLHDVLEDTPWTADALRREGFSDAVVDAVESLTRRAGETFDDFILRARSNAIARRVKLADLADNMDLGRIREPTAADRDRILRYERATATLREPE